MWGQQRNGVAGRAHRGHLIGDIERIEHVEMDSEYILRHWEPSCSLLEKRGRNMVERGNENGPSVVGLELQLLV